MALRFENLIEQHHDEMFAYLRRLAGDDAWHRFARHDVIASDGSLGGYTGGLALKPTRWLLPLEGAW